MPIKKLYDEFISVFVEYVKENYIDFIIIDGDYFDHRLFLKDEESEYAYLMMIELIKASKNKQIKIRFVYGTESHECDQYGILSKIESEADIKVIHHVQEEEIFPGVQILYLPEEHVLDKNEYYADYLKNDQKYNYVFGHGIIREAMKEAAVAVETGTGKRRKVPVFSTAELRRICKGQTFFGHYHVNTDMDDVFYCGSFSRWKFGEDAPKGFYSIEYNMKKDTYKAEFIENTMADVYKTISFGYDHEIFKNDDSLYKGLDKVDSLIKSNVFDHVRFEFNLPETIDNPEATINYINERYKFNDKVKTEVVHGYAAKKKQMRKEEVKKEFDKHAFIFDKNLPIEDKTSNFIKLEYNRDISPERVSLYLFKPLNEVLQTLEKNNTELEIE